MALDPVTSIGDAVANVASALSPIINDAEAQKYENEYKTYISQYNEIMAASPIDVSTLNTYVMQLRSRSGSATGSLGGITIAVPMEDHDFYIERANLCNLYEQSLAAYQSAKNNSNSS